MEANTTVEELPSNPTPLLVLPVLLSVLWALYELFYAPRVIAFLLTKIANLFLTDSGIYIKSVRIHLLTGRLIFKDVHYYTRDYSLRVFDGYLSIRWWWQCGNNVCGSCDTVERTAPCLQLTLNGLEWHWYNRSDVYDEWGVEKEETSAEELEVQEEGGFMRWWNSLKPSIHLSIRRGRILLGNHLVERSLVFYFSSTEAHYSITEGSNAFDERMHVVIFNAQNMRAVLEPSVGYRGPVSKERPPVLCEELEDAYLFLKSDSARITYYQDSPGIVPLGDNPPPKYAFDIKLGTNSIINYSCYGNRQRTQIQKFFFPNDHTEKPYTQLPEPGQRRIYTMFDVAVEATSPMTLYQLFSDRHGNPAHLAVSVGVGSRVSVHQPWVYSREGQTSVVKGSLRNPRVSSSLDYQVLGSAESLDFQTDLQFPRLWNQTQTWDMRFTGDCVQANILFAYVDFINDLLDDWLGDEPADLLTFVPIDWNITIDLTRYEIFLFTNRYNWVDVAMDSAENTRMAFCGTSGQITFGFPFTQFNPPEQKVHFKAVGENIVVRHYVPPSCTTRQSLFSLSSLNKHRWRSMTTPTNPAKVTEVTAESPKPTPIIIEPPTPTSPVISAPIMGDIPTSPTKLSSFRPPSNLDRNTPIKAHHSSLTDFHNPNVNELPDRESIPMGYRGVTQYEDGWLDLASGPLITIAIDYTSHAHNTKPGTCTKLHPNILRIDVEAPVVLIRVFGCLARDLLALKENYPGEYINFKTFNSNIPTPQSVPERPHPPHLGAAPPPDPPPGPHEPAERTMWVYVDFRLKNITAEFPTHLPEGWPRDFPLPSLCTDQLRVAVEYTNRDTTVRLDVEPLSVHVPTQVPDPLKRSHDSSKANELGHVIVSGLSLHCHGFIELLCQERVEYAWLMKLTIQRITGAVSTLQLATILDWFLTAFVHTASFGDGCRVAPDAEVIEPKIEPISEEIKYKLLDVVIGEGDLVIADGDVITRIQTPGFDLGFCNLHSHSETLGLSFQVHGATLSTFVPLDSTSLVESGLVDLGPISGDLSLREPLDCVPERQLEFLRLADKHTKRLWFLWESGQNCGCWGACLFLEGAIKRPLTRDKKDSVVYNAQVTSQGIEALEGGLLGHSVRELSCLQTIHRGLLEHYHYKYMHIQPSPAEAMEAMENLRPYSLISDDESFVSARSSLSSLLEEELEFKSLDNFSSLASVVRPKNKPAALNLDSSPTSEHEREGDLDTYKDVSNTHTLTDVRLRVAIDPPLLVKDEEESFKLHASVKRSYSDGAALRPRTTPKTPSNQDYLQLRLLHLVSSNTSQIPVVAPKGGALKSKEQSRSQAHKQNKKESLAMFSLCVNVGGQWRAILTPKAVAMFHNILESVNCWFSTRSHLAVMDALSHSCLSNIRDHFTQLFKTTPSFKPTQPLLHLTVAMETQSSLAIQLLQVPKKAPQIATGLALNEITRHLTLVNVFLSGLCCHTLFQTSTEVGGTTKRILSSIDILGDLNLPVVQTSICALVPNLDNRTLLGISPEQSLLSFELTQGRDLSVCTLLEAGLRDVGVTVVAKLLQSEMHEDSVVDWSHIHLYSGLTSVTPTHAVETKNNTFVIDVALPLFWSQVASTHTGIADSQTGGLDLFVLYEALEAWQDGIMGVASLAGKLSSDKSARDRQVLRTIVANAARNSMTFKKSFNPVHSDVTFALRQSVAYACLQQLWQTLPAFSEGLAPRDNSESLDCELVATMLAMSARLYSLHEEADNKHMSMDSSAQDGRLETGSVGYISISPSPSELAIPNAMLAGCLDLRDIDYDRTLSRLNHPMLLALREALLPLFNETNLSVPPQLRPVCHNTAIFSGEVGVSVREISVFVTPPTSHTHTRHTDTPVLHTEHIDVRSSLQYSTESTPPQPQLTLLPNITDSTLSSKVNLASGCIISIEGISLTLTTPLLKLGRHMMETARFRSHLLKQADIFREDNLVTPQPSHVEVPAPVAQEEPQPQPQSEITLFSQSIAAIVRSREVKGETTPPVSSPAAAPLVSPTGSKLLSPQDDATKKHLRRPSITSSVTSEEIAIMIDETKSSEVLSDTVGYDTQDSIQPTTINHSLLSPHSSISIPTTLSGNNHTSTVVRSLSLPSSQLFFSVFGLLRVKHIEANVQIETTKASLQFDGVSGSVDVRKATKELGDLLPTYLSVAATLQKSCLLLTDRGLPDSEVLSFKAQPVYVSTALCGGVEVPTCTYRCLVKVCGVELCVPQSPVIIHRRYQALMPALTAIYKDVFADSAHSQPSTPSAPVVNIADVKLPPKLPQGFVHFSLDEVSVVLSPLPSLTVTYTVTPVVAQVETRNVIQFELSVGDHLVRFSPRGPHKDDLTLRSLPHLSLKGKVQSSRHTMIPSVSLELSVKQVVVDITTDVLNQLLVLQNSFIKEVNDLIQLFASLGDSMPQKRPSKQEVKPEPENGLEMMSFLESCRLSLAGIVVTISTPLSTAIRFSTGKIDMHVSNTSFNNSASLNKDYVTRNRFNVMGRVDIDVNAALGILQDSGPDDELIELAYFKMRVSLRNTVQNLAAGGSGEEVDTPVVVDTFAISIQNPHLYVQSSAVEQGILFWLNCKSVYNYWQNERKQLNAEVQAATEALMEKIQHRPTQLQTPSIDFSKPRLVKLTVSDVGVCMPLTAVSSTPLSTKSQSFPALVITIKEMQFQLNLSHKIASTGNFETFCVRFAEQFYVRQKTWTLDPRKHKFANCGSIHHGTFRLCVATQKRVSETNPQVSLGEKLLWAFQWDMSGIDVNANTDIGRHTSAIVRTITTIGIDLDGSKMSKAQSSSGLSSKGSGHRALRRPASVAGTPHMRRSKSVVSHRDESYIMTLEEELAKQTRKIQKLKAQAVSADVLQREKETLKCLQDDLARAMHRAFRQPRGSVSRWFSRPAETGEAPTGGSMGRRISQAVRKQLFSNQDAESVDLTPSPTHFKRRTKSLSFPAHRHLKSGRKQTLGSSSSPSPSVTPTPHEEETFDLSDGEEVGVVKEDEGFVLPTIDVEVDVTINVDYGKVILRTEESNVAKERKMSLPVLHPAQSPFMKTRVKPTDSYSSSFVESVIFIPALTVKAHYQSIVGRSYSNAPIPRSPSHSPPSIPISHLLPVKKGVLSISAVIASLPEPLRFTPSLLEFIEQVARPTIAATIISSSSSTESEEESEAVASPFTDNWPLSFPVDVTLGFQIQPSTMHLTCQPHSRVECVIQSPDVNFVISFSLFTPQHNEIDQTSPVSSGVGSGTRSNSDKILMFNNLYITGCFTTFTLQLLTPPVSGRKTSAGMPMGMEKKEALSLTLGQALIHFSRKSVLSPLSIGTERSVDDYVPSSKLQVSVVTDIASVVFGYDMRRLNDITTFRRYWYQRTLVEALFIGTKKKNEEETGMPNENMGVVIPQELPGKEASVLDDTISATIVVAAKVEDFRVCANFAQVMGNANLLVTQLRCEVHCDVVHNELVLLEMEGKLERGDLDARGGVIAGNMLMEGAQTHVTTHSRAGNIPVHKCSTSIHLIEGRIDYMSSCCVLARAAALNLDISDSWEGLQLDSSGKIPQFASVQILADFSWDTLQLSIHRSTTKSMFNMVQKIYEFVMQQKRRSERTISLMLPTGSAASKALHAYREEQKRIAKEEETKDKGYLRHHWLWAMRVGSVELMRTMGLHTPVEGHHTVSLGAKITVKGKNFCLVCFHGPSFRETEWAVFNIDSVYASFSTQAIPGLGKAQLSELTEEGSDYLPAKQVRTCQQIVNLSLGSTPWEEAEKVDKLAAIYRVSARHTRPPTIVGTSTENWLNYACIDSQLHPDKYLGDTSTLVRLSKKLNVQSILLVPAFNVELLNDHFWPQSAVLVDEEAQMTPRVECSLTSSFAKGISVSTNVDHYLFLHDLVKAYIEYLDKHNTPHSLPSDPSVTESTDSAPPPKSTPLSRTFECVYWELDPHLLLISSAGTGQINPHISWLLEKLGFEHARTTIPKWIQRVAMDPLDMVVANGVELLIKVTATKKLQQRSRASSPPPPPPHPK